MVVNTGQYVRCQHLSLPIFGPSPSVRVRGLVQHNGGSTVPLLSLLMVHLLTGSFTVGLRIPHISPILAKIGLSVRSLWAMHFPVHLKGWELSQSSRPTSNTELFKPVSIVEGNYSAGLTSHPENNLSGERIERPPGVTAL